MPHSDEISVGADGLKEALIFFFFLAVNRSVAHLVLPDQNRPHFCAKKNK